MQLGRIGGNLRNLPGVQTPVGSHDDGEDSLLSSMQDPHTLLSLAAGANKYTMLAQPFIDEDGEENKVSTQKQKLLDDEHCGCLHDSIRHDLGLAPGEAVTEADLDEFIATRCPDLHDKMNNYTTAKRTAAALAGGAVPMVFMPGLGWIAGGIASLATGFAGERAYTYFSGEETNVSDDLREVRRRIRAGEAPERVFDAIGQMLRHNGGVAEHADDEFSHGLPDEAHTRLPFRSPNLGFAA